MYRKAMTLVEVVSVILIVITAMAIGYWYFTKGQPSTEERFKLDTCKASVDKISFLTEKTAGIAPTTELICPIFQKNIAAEETESIAAQVATEVSNCWYKTDGECSADEIAQTFVDLTMTGCMKADSRQGKKGRAPKAKAPKAKAKP